MTHSRLFSGRVTSVMGVTPQVEGSSQNTGAHSVAPSLEFSATSHVTHDTRNGRDVERLPARFFGDMPRPFRIVARASYLPCMVAMGAAASEVGVVDRTQLVTFNALETQVLAVHANRRRLAKAALWTWTETKLVEPDFQVRHSKCPDQTGRHSAKRTQYGDGNDTRLSLGDRMTVGVLLRYFELTLVAVHVAPHRESPIATEGSGGRESSDEQDAAWAGRQ